MRLSICPDRLEGESARGRVRASVACCCACVCTILEGECLYAEDGDVQFAIRTGASRGTSTFSDTWPA